MDSGMTMRMVSPCEDLVCRYSVYGNVMVVNVGVGSWNGRAFKEAKPPRWRV